MKYELESIPVHDAWARATPCPLCDLMAAAEVRHIGYYLGSSVMNPETRIQANRTGFCDRHLPMMRDAGKAHHLGLICHTRIQTLRADLGGPLNVLDTAGITRTAARRAAKRFSHEVRRRLSDCLVCRSLDRDLMRYSYTAVLLYGREPEFRGMFDSSGGPCLSHAADLADMAAEALDPPELRSFLSGLATALRRNFGELESDVLHFTRKFDAQNDNLEWGSSRDAHVRAVRFLCGRRGDSRG